MARAMAVFVFFGDSFGKIMEENGRKVKKGIPKVAYRRRMAHALHIILLRVRPKRVHKQNICIFRTCSSATRILPGQKCKKKIKIGPRDVEIRVRSVRFTLKGFDKMVKIIFAIFGYSGEAGVVPGCSQSDLNNKQNWTSVRRNSSPKRAIYPRRVRKIAKRIFAIFGRR